MEDAWMVSQRDAVTPPSKTHVRLVLVACILASSVVGMDSMMTTIALPAIADGLGAGMSVQQWIVAAFLLSLGSLLLVGGALGDIHGRWFVFGVGVAGFGVAALVCALAPNASVLVVGRILQGAAAALLLPSVLAVITATFSGEQRSKAIASWSAWSGVAVIAGPVVGGFLIDLLSWRAIYGVQLPCAALVLLLVVRVAPERADEAAGGGNVDLGGALLAIPSVGGPAFFLIQGPRLGWADPLVVGALVVGLVALVCLVLWERRARQPLLPLVLFRIRNFTVINVVTFVLYGALISCGTYTVLFLQDNLDYSPAAAGVVAAVPLIVLFVMSGRFGALADRFGGRLFIGGGAIVAGLGMLLLLRTDTDADLVTVVLPSVLVHGIGLAMLVAPLTSGVMSVSEDRAGAASGINNAVARTGSMMAIAFVGLLISLRFSTNLDNQLAGAATGDGLDRAIEQARERPLSDVPADGVTAAEHSLLEPLLASASVEAFHFGVLVMGGLALLAGVLACIGLRDSRARTYDAAGTLGCPITGARTHRDGPPIGSRVR